MNKIDLGNKINSIDFEKEYEYDSLKLQTQGINFDRKLTYESTDTWIGLDENNNKVRMSDSQPVTIYITTQEINIGLQFGNGDHILAYWGNNKKKIDNLLKEQIEEDNIKGKKELILIGDYKKKEQYLYAQYNSKYAPYRDEFPKINNLSERKINISKPFRLEFKLADIGGEQYRALNDIENSIIDGSAGTGKSTIALQKLKYLYINYNIEQKDIIIIVKNFEAITFFKTLLLDKELNLNDIKIYTANSFLETHEIDFNSLNINQLMELKDKAIQLKKDIENFIFKRNAIPIYKHYNSLLMFLNERKILHKEEKYSLEKINIMEDEYSNTIYKDYFLAFEYLHRYKNYYDELYRKVKQKVNIENKLKKLEQKLNNNESLTDKEYKNYEKFEIELDKLTKKELTPYIPTREQEKILRVILKKLYFTKEYISNDYLKKISVDEKTLILKYLNLEEYEYDTILIDEAQDYSLVELEILRLYAKRVILTGDILQNLDEDDSQIKDWNDILFVDEIFGVEDKNGEEKLNIFTLKHNFRQTYQLANASYNFRQLLLNEKIEDIEQDYFLSEKELNGKPYELVKIIFNQNIKQYIKNKIEYIKNRFTSQIPIVIIYKTEEEKKQYRKELSSFRISYDTKEVKDIDVILVDILEAKGKQFPVVVSNIDELTDREIYLIMTRGQFEVEFLSSQKEIENEYLNILYINEWIKANKINFKTNKEEKIVEDIVIQDEIEPSNLENEKNEQVNCDEKKEESKPNQEEESSAESIHADLLEAKEKHQGEVKEIEILLDPNVVSDIDTYIKKVQDEYEKNIKNAPTTVTTHIVNKKVKIGRKETKWFLEQQYKGFCQICGFTFTQRKGINKNKKYFELFDWFSEKITKQKVNVVQAGSSLCLCARCHSGVKYGSFTANLVDILKSLDVKKMSFDEFVSKISVMVNNKEIPECYDFIENDMYKVDIRLFNQEEFIFYTEEHFLHLFVMLRSGGE